MVLSNPSVASEQQELAMLLLEYQTNPVAFVREVLSIEPDEWQAAVLMDLAGHGMVSVAACHGPGKDAVAAWAVLWALCCFYEVKIPSTAPTAPQLYDLLWAEVAKWRAQMLPWFRDQLDMKKDRIERQDAPEQAFASARTARKENPEALQGFHSEVILVVVDEASGVPDIIFEVLQGALTGAKAMCLLIGNPTQLTGFFWRTHNDPTEMGAWKRYRVFADCAHDGSPLPVGVFTSKRVSAKYVNNMARYGRDSNVFLVRVLGRFPKSGADQTIPHDWVSAALMRELPAAGEHALCLGVDVARFGSDDSATVVRQGQRISAGQTWHGCDVAESSGKVIAQAKALEAFLGVDGVRRAAPEKLYIFVDTTGLGAGVADNVRAYARDNNRPWIVVDVDAGGKALDDTCFRLRDSLWWAAREYFESHEPAISHSIDTDDRDKLIAELAAPKYGYTPSGEIRIETKDQLKARNVPSPNMADALIHTFKFRAMKPAPVKTDGWRDRQNAQASGDWEWK